MWEDTSQLKALCTQLMQYGCVLKKKTVLSGIQLTITRSFMIHTHHIALLE
jgi:hypothetical protein